QVAIAGLDGLADQLPGFQVLDDDCVEFRALGVLGIGEQFVVVRMGCGGDFGVGLALGQGVGVEQDLLAIRLSAGPTAEEGMLTALVGAAVVFSGAVAGGDGGVVLLDAALHVLGHLRLQVVGRGQYG